MIIYNTRWVEALSVSKEAKRWYASEIISDEQYATIKVRFTVPLYTPNLFIRITLFIFTYIALIGVYGIVFAAIGSSGDRGLGIILVILGLVSFVVLEALIKSKNLHRSGIDDALLYASLVMSISGLIWLYLDVASQGKERLIPWLIALPFLLWGVMRFADRVVAAAAYICMLGVIFTPLVEGGPIAKTILPFVAMVVGSASYFLARAYKKREALRPYEECLYIVELLALATFYAGGNYFIVRMGNEMLMGGVIPEGHDVPLAWLFYALTALTPVAYILRGLMMRDHLLLRSGLIAVVLSVLTFRYYFALIPPEVALIIAGLVLFLVAVVATRLLKKRHDGFTDKHLLREKLKDVDAETLVISQTLGASPQAQTTEKKFEGGSGEFGGGGTSGNW